MQVLKSILFYYIKAQSPQSGYNYPSPFNPLAPGAQGDLGQQPTPYAGQPGYNNPQYTPSGKKN